MGIEIIGSGQGSEYRAMMPTQRRRFEGGRASAVSETQFSGRQPAGRNAADAVPGLKTGDEDAYLNEALEQLRTVSDIFNRRLDFEVNEDTGRIVVKVIDTKTDKVVKEIPPEQLVQLAAKIQDMIGVLVDEER